MDAVTLYDRELTEPGDIPAYIKSFFSALSFVRKQKISLVYFMDWIWWKPAEILAFRLLRLKMLTFVGFYKDQEALKGFVRFLSLIIVNSASTAESFITKGWEERVRVVHNFLDLERFDSSVQSRETLFEGIADKSLIGFVGALHPIKGLESFLDALVEVFPKDPDSLAVIVGAEKIVDYSEGLRERARGLGILERVRFIGHRDDIPSVMKSLDILVVPSLSEPFGYVNIEAGAAAKPVVATRVGGIPEIVVDGETGILVEPENSEQIAEACLKLLKDKELRLRMGDAGRIRVEKFFSIEYGLARFEKIFERQLGLGK